MTGFGVEFFPLGGDPRVLIELRVKHRGFLPGLHVVDAARLLQQTHNILYSSYDACILPDPEHPDATIVAVMVANPIVDALNDQPPVGAPLSAPATPPRTTPTLERVHLVLAVAAICVGGFAIITSFMDARDPPHSTERQAQTPAIANQTVNQDHQADVHTQIVEMHVALELANKALYDVLQHLEQQQ